MSVQALGWVFDHSPTKGSDRLVLLSIANHAGTSPVDGAWESYPGVALIQREAGLDRERTVQDALGRLAASKAIVRVVNGAPDERIRKDRRPNLYRVLLARGVTCGDTRCRWCGVTGTDTPKAGDGVTDDAERGDGSRRDGVTESDATGCRETSPEPSVNQNPEPEMNHRGTSSTLELRGSGPARSAAVAKRSWASVEPTRPVVPGVGRPHCSTCDGMGQVFDDGASQSRRCSECNPSPFTKAVNE